MKKLPWHLRIRELYSNPYWYLNRRLSYSTPQDASKSSKTCNREYGNPQVPKEKRGLSTSKKKKKKKAYIGIISQKSYLLKSKRNKQLFLVLSSKLHRIITWATIKRMKKQEKETSILTASPKIRNNNYSWRNFNMIHQKSFSFLLHSCSIGFNKTQQFNVQMA